MSVKITTPAGLDAGLALESVVKDLTNVSYGYPTNSTFPVASTVEFQRFGLEGMFRVYGVLTDNLVQHENYYVSVPVGFKPNCSYTGITENGHRYIYLVNEKQFKITPTTNRSKGQWEQFMIRYTVNPSDVKFG